MAEIERYVFPYKEIVTALIKAQDIHEGIWALYLEFGIRGANIGMQMVNEGVPTPKTTEGPPTEVVPSAIIPVQKIGIARTDYLSNIAVDAAEANPKTAK